ncbi:MAG TPA: TlpA disulfide reductase family protein [Flavobacterium sp.]|nr:TlpA disulfide reductase family protein [Flavobacterium sp.]
MKKLLLVAISTAFLFSCNKETNTDGYQVSGTIDSVEDGAKVFIETPDNQGGVISLDTAFVKNGKFEFKGKAKEIEIAYLQIQDLQGKIPFVLENQKITIKAYKDSLQASKIGGSYNNDELTKFNKEFENFQKKVAKFQAENSDAFMAAQQANDTDTMTKISEDYMVLEKEFTVFTNEYVSKNPNSFVTLMLLAQMADNPDADFTKVKADAEALAPELKSTKIGLEIQEKLKSLSPTSVGQMAPDFSAPNPEGKIVSLKESLGKVTLIDFWASWCGPCRKENPNVVALYNEFHDKGFNIIGVSLDKEDKKHEWIKAIEVDKLTWTQISNLKFWQDPIAKQYNVQGIPATFLLDAEGRIVAKNLRGAELRAKVAELLAN